MANHFTRSTSLDLFRRVAVAVLTVFCLYWYTFDLWAQRKLPFIESSLSGAIHRPVTLQSAHFDPFRGFLLYGVELRQHPPNFSPVHIRRVQVIPDFQLFPVPAIHVRKLRFDGPSMTLSLRPETVFRAGLIMKNFSPNCGNIGALKILLDLTSFEVRGAKITLEPAEKNRAWQQNFENVDFKVDRGWIRSSTVLLSGNIAGHPEASFRIICDTNGETGRGLHSNLRLEFHHFTTAFLNKHLEGRFRLPKTEELTAAVFFKIRGGRLFQARGRVVSPDLRFVVKGGWNEKGVQLDKISVKSGPVELIGDGRLEWTQASGLCLFQLISEKIPLEKFTDMIPSLTPDAGHVQFFAALKGDVRDLEPSLDAVFTDCGLHDAAGKIRVAHLNGWARASKKGLELRESWAFVNDLPLRVDARWLTLKKDRFTFEASTYPGQLPALRSSNPINASFKAAGVRLKDGWSGYARLMDENFTSGRPQKDVWALSFHGLSQQAGSWACRSLELRRFNSDSLGDAIDITLHRFDFHLLINKEWAQVEVQDMSLKTGQAKLRIRIRFAGPSYQVSAAVTDMDVSKFLRYLKKDYPVSGRITASIFWAGIRNDPRCRVRFQVTDGSLGSNTSMAQLADQTGIDVLRAIRFRSFSGEAHYAKSAWHLRNVQLTGDQARLGAKLKVIGRNISGFLSVKFPTSCIRKSSDLRWLLNFVGSRDEWVDFDFRVAGFCAAPRVQWLGGEFKKKVQSHLAPWMKIELARQVEKRMAENSTGQTVHQ